jgi:hypothetical protein
MPRTKKPPVIPEREIQATCLAIMHAAGWIAFRRNTGAIPIAAGDHKRRFIRFSEKGQADIWGVLPDGRHFECEVKRKGEKPSSAQEAWLKKMNQLGGRRGSVAFWCDSTESCELIVQAINDGLWVDFEEP